LAVSDFLSVYFDGSCRHEPRQSIKIPFLYFLICSERTIDEIIRPNFNQQQAAFTNQFSGMTAEAFAYEEYESVREQLVKTIHGRLIYI